jgi:sarcosine oxidase subunit gamma
MSEDQLLVAPELPSAPYQAPRGDYVLRARPVGHVLSALGFPGAEAPRIIAEAGPFALRSAGPQSWVVVGETPLSPAQLAEREQRRGGAVALIDQSHGCERLEIFGPRAAHKLATGLAVDLSLPTFPEGASCEALFGPIAIHLTRTGRERFEILVGRSLAMSLWRRLTHEL